MNVSGLSFSSRELRDLAVAWVALGVAFAIFFAGGGRRAIEAIVGGGVVAPVLVSLLTAGAGFLVHEVAHKVVAVRFDQVAEFRADYTMLALAVGAGLAGFLFAAPGAVYHRGYLDERENAFIALAGPVTNVLLAGVFAPLLFLGGFLGEVGQLGVTVNAALAAFNMIPFGPLDGKTVRNWSTVGFGVSFLVCAGLAVLAILYVGFPY